MISRRLKSTVVICATSEVILIVLVLYFIVPPTRAYIDVFTHVSPINNQCKPWGKNPQENNYFFCISLR